MQGFSLLIYVLVQLGVMAYIQTVLIGIAVIATVLYFIKRA